MNEPRVRTPTTAAVAARSAPLRVRNPRVCSPGGPIAGTEISWIAHLHGGRENVRFPCVSLETSYPKVRKLRCWSLSVMLKARRWTLREVPGFTCLDSTNGASQKPSHNSNKRVRRTTGAGIEGMCPEYQKAKLREPGSAAS